MTHFPMTTSWNLMSNAKPTWASSLREKISSELQSVVHGNTASQSLAALPAYLVPCLSLLRGRLDGWWVPDSHKNRWPSRCGPGLVLCLTHLPEMLYRDEISHLLLWVDFILPLIAFELSSCLSGSLHWNWVWLKLLLLFLQLGFQLWKSE